MKKKNGFLALILVVVSIAAITALVVTNIEKICDFLDALKKKAKEACCCNEEASHPIESDFEDMEI
ncbi:MAG TPA: hypothetical protein GXZ65_05225 [Clostridiales bacterium]|nr:hypothetical protein [Clostridiales bacterium]